ncbi:MAG: AlpA family phage regulatory protein [Deltaproteobacteria bacterium]|nr:AlpA family phage regulatory protein [Deltaproteobacteria bacterium]
MVPKLIRLPVVLSHTGLSRSSLYNRIQDGLWPKPVTLGSRAVAWPEEEVAAINAARIAGRTNEEIHRLVVELETIRKP